MSFSIIAGLALTLEWRKIIESFRGASVWALVGVAILTGVPNFVIGPLRLKLLTNAAGGKLAYGEAIKIIMGNEPLNLFLPMKGGDFLISVYLKFKAGLNISDGLFIIISDKFVTLLAITIFFFTGSLIILDTTLVAVATALIIPSLIFYFFPWIVIKPFTALIKLISEKAALSLGKPENFFLKARAEKRFLFLLLAMLFSFGEIFSTYIVLNNLGVKAGLGEVFCVVSGIILFNALPFSISGLGIRELTLIGFFGAAGTRETIVAAAMIIFAIDLVLPSLFGLLFTRMYLKGVTPANAKDKEKADDDSQS